jgi:hypothetical protein
MLLSVAWYHDADYDQTSMGLPYSISHSYVIMVKLRQRHLKYTWRNICNTSTTSLGIRRDCVFFYQGNTDETQSHTHRHEALCVCDLWQTVPGQTDVGRTRGHSFAGMIQQYITLITNIIIIILLMSPLLGHRPSLWITHKENGP